MIKIKLSSLNLLRNSGYTIIEEDKLVLIRYNPPTINEAIDSDESYETEDRFIEIIGEKQGDYVIITDAYIIENNNKRRRLDNSELELWAEYIGGT